MLKFRRKIFLALIAVLLSNCSKYNMISYNDFYRSCDQIVSEISYSREYQNSLGRLDGMKLRYLLILPAVIELSAAKSNYKKLDDKIKGLEALAYQKKCYSSYAAGRRFQNNQMQQNPNYGYGNYQRQVPRQYYQNNLHFPQGLNYPQNYYNNLQSFNNF